MTETQLTQEINMTDNTEKTPTVDTNSEAPKKLDNDSNQDTIVTKQLTEDERKEIDTDGDGVISQTEAINYLKKSKESRQKHSNSVDSSHFSQKTLKYLDKDGDGTISIPELNDYIRSIKSKANRYKCLCIGTTVCFFLILFLGTFGIFLLGFEITKQFEIKNTSTTLGTRRLTDADGKRLSSMQGVIDIEVSDFWNVGIDDSSRKVTVHYGYYGENNDYIYCQISRVEIVDDVATLYDYTGNIWFEYHRYGYNGTTNITGSGNWLMYESDSNDQVTVRLATIDVETTPAPAPNNQRRRLARPTTPPNQPCSATTSE